VPEKAESDKSKEPGLSRLQQLRKDRQNEAYEPDMPPVSCGHYLLDHLYGAGPTMSGGMEAAPLTHGELQAYQANTGVALTEWEVTTLRRLSFKTTCSESHKATKRNCPAPWQTEERQIVDRLEVARSLGSVDRGDVGFVIMKSA
jgi:hypothetical protein